MGAGLILAAGFILKGRKNQADRNSRYRTPRPTLKLDRASAGLGRAKERSPLLAKARRPAGSPAAPITLGVVLVVLSLWLAAAYIRPSAESAESGTAVVQTASPPPQPAQVGTLAGRLSTAPEPSVEPSTPAPAAKPAATATPATPMVPPSAPVAAAAALNQAAAAQAGGSALSQVGLMPTSRQTASESKPPPAAPAPKSSPESTSRPAASEAKPAVPAPSASAPKPITPPAPTVAANPNMVRAAAGGSGGSGRGILNNTEGFTVHLGSFTDQANAEKFRTKLTAAGEPAAVSGITLDGRLYYRVMSGRFDTRAAADAHGRDLRRRGLTDDRGTFFVKPINSDN